MMVCSVMLLCTVSCNSGSDNNRNQRPVTRSGAGTGIPYEVAKGYFLRNDADPSVVRENPKISDAQRFSELFGTATTMGRGGTPTAINFNRQYVIAVTEEPTDLAARLEPVALEKVDNDILFTYNYIFGQPQSYTMQPVLLIVVDNQYTGNVNLIRKAED